MNKLSLVLAASLVAGVAYAGESDNKAYGYVNVAGGRAHLNAKCFGVTTCDTDAMGLKLIGGYKLSNGIGFEGGYVNFGKAKAADATGSEQVKTSAITLGGLYTVSMGNWGLNMRLGAAVVKTKYTNDLASLDISASKTSTKPYAGVGLEYGFTPTTKLELGVDTTKSSFNGQTANARLVTVGFTVGF
ncbi:MAG: outer membrane beta-barrel protein [Methylotenera sp.]|jgi:hypothetical protein|nr:outer membrane beta-barrel protein [Methylotenera sp.]